MSSSATAISSALLITNKPSDITSRAVVDIVQQVANTSQVGHSGTLDPMATGVLLLAVGSATRLVEYLHELGKVYVAEFELGKTSDTLDVTGKVQPVDIFPIISRQQIEDECRRWVGPVLQVPPRYSAIKIQGKRAYAMARSGIEFTPAPREVFIESIEVLGFCYPLLSLRICCGSGTYVRSLGRDIAAGLGTSAIMTRLCRLAIGPFTLDEAVSLEQLRSLEAIQRGLVNPVRGLPHWPKVELDPTLVKAAGHGKLLELAGVAPAAHRVAALDCQGNLVALLSRGNAANYWKPFRVFQAAKATNQPTIISPKHNPES